MAISTAKTTIPGIDYRVTGRFLTTSDGCGIAYIYPNVETRAVLRFNVKRSPIAEKGERIDDIRIPYTIENTSITSFNAVFDIVEYNNSGEQTTNIPVTLSGFDLTLGDHVGVMTVDDPEYDNDIDTRLYRITLTINNTNPTVSKLVLCSTEINHSHELVENGGLNSAIDQEGDVIIAATPNKFHGWWANTNRGILGGFGTIDNVTACEDAYIFIDTTVTPIKVTTMGGNGKDIRYPNPNYEVSANAFYDQLDETTLSHIDNTLSPFQLADLWAIKLQPDEESIFVSEQLGRDYKGTMQMPSSTGCTPMDAALYRRVDPNSMQTQIMPQYDEVDYRFTDYTRPTELFKYLFNTYLYHIGVINPAWNTDFVGFYNAHAIFNEYLSPTGRTHTFNINKMRITKNGSGLTDVYYVLNSTSFITPGSTVTVAGLGAGWAGANGAYTNGVSTAAWGGVANPRGTHLDYDDGAPFMGYLGHFYLNLDSSALPAYAVADNTSNPPHYDAAGVARSVPHWGGGVATVSATHRVTDDMEYPLFFAACHAMIVDVFKVMCHWSNDYFLLNPADKFLPPTWDQLKSALAAGTALTNTFQFIRINNIIPSRGYGGQSLGFWAYDPPNNTNPAFPSWTFNDPYGWLPTVGSAQDYEFPRNYLTGVRNLYYTLDGPVTEPIHFFAGLFGYPNLAGNLDGGSYFVGLTAPLDFDDVAGSNPDPSIWTLMADFIIPADAAAKQHYFGFVNSTYSGGKKLAYIRWGTTVFQDPAAFMSFAQFEPPGTVSARQGTESGMPVFAEMMKYLMTSHPLGAGLDGVIIDNRGNIGGASTPILQLASMFGAKRKFSDGQSAIWRDNCNRDIVTFQSLGITSANNLLQIGDAIAEYIYVDETVARYGANSVFTGGKVIMINDNQAISGGDVTPQHFYGENLDRDLGAGTTFQMIGDLDGRIHGSHFGDTSAWPLQKYSERLKDDNGEPISPLAYLIGDQISYSVSANGQPFSLQNNVSEANPPFDASATGLAGGNPMTNEFEELIYLDTGLMGVPYPDPALPGWPGPDPPLPGDHTTWRDRWLEQAIKLM